MARGLALGYELRQGQWGDQLTRGAWLTSLAAPLLLVAPLLLAGANASAGPLPPAARSSAPIWEEHGAGRTDGLSVGAYPLPPEPERNDSPDSEGMDRGAKERWLRRHYQWLRALGEVLSVADPNAERRTAEPRGQAGFAPPASQGKLRVGDMVVLYADQDAERLTPHLLDDGALREDPEIGPGNGEALDFIERDRLTIEAAKVVAEYFGPLARDVRSSFGAVLPDSERRRAPPRYDTPRYDVIQLENSLFAAPPSEAASGPAGPARPREPAERVSMIGFFKGIALDILSAPTTYLLTFLALLAWLILRATVFSRS